MTISVKILCDNLNGITQDRVTTFLLTYPRFIHQELLTHRVFSRNSASSRAIPTKKILSQVFWNPEEFIHWGKLQKGMQASQQLAGWRRWLTRRCWRLARYPAMAASVLMHALGAHKQVANRALEPWMTMQVLLTSTRWHNFYRLRYSRKAQPELAELARQMLEAHAVSNPRVCRPGDWHVPFSELLPEETQEDFRLALKVCTARAARLSYKTFDGQYSLERDCGLHDDLKSDGHWSAFEHCSMAIDPASPCDTGNLDGWCPYRKTFPGEDGLKGYREPFQPQLLLEECRQRWNEER